ncbi:MAG TPA: lasso RiPP family leader peptide-containing protein [Gaiella sp.]|jgi:hypothetical protein
MKHDSTKHDTRPDETPEARPYEPPRIEDYGTLVELTAGKGNGDPDFLGSWESKGGGGGGYS